MKRWFTTAHVAILSLFLIVSAAMIGYQILYVWPAQRCDREGLWWDERDRQCLSPIPIERLTGRGIQDYKVAPAAPAPAPAR